MFGKCRYCKISFERYKNTNGDLCPQHRHVHLTGTCSCDYPNCNKRFTGYTKRDFYNLTGTFCQDHRFVVIKSIINMFVFCLKQNGVSKCLRKYIVRKFVIAGTFKRYPILRNEFLLKRSIEEQLLRYIIKTLYLNV